MLIFFPCFLKLFSTHPSLFSTRLDTSVLICNMQCGHAFEWRGNFFWTLWIWISPKVKCRCLHCQTSVILWADENRRWPMLSLLVQSPENLVWPPPWDVATEGLRLFLWAGAVIAPSSANLDGPEENDHIWILIGCVSELTVPASSSFSLTRQVWPAAIARSTETIAFGYVAARTCLGLPSLQVGRDQTPGFTGLHYT